ncbi:hypothetical protein ACFSLT_17670 [Novosphingobium resinovorum]
MAFDIGEIYDAAFDRTRFPGLIERLGVAMGAQAGFIGWSDPDRQVGFQFQYGNDPVWLNRYVETYAAQDVLLPHLHAIPEGECQSAWDLLQMPEVRDSAFYREYLAPQGIVDNLAVNLIKRPGIVASLALLRRMPSERYTRAECAKLAVLVPHLRRAIYIQSHLVRAQEHAAADRAFAGSAGSSVMLLSAEHVLLEAAPALVPCCACASESRWARASWAAPSRGRSSTRSRSRRKSYSGTTYPRFVCCSKRGGSTRLASAILRMGLRRRSRCM